MVPCDCERRDEYFDIHPDAIDAFLDDFIQVTSDLLANYHLYRCVSCKTLWIVDDVTRGPMAVRATSESDIRDFDERVYRRHLCIQMHGGLNDRHCSFQNCENHALRGTRTCVDHAYPEFTG